MAPCQASVPGDLVWGDQSEAADKHHHDPTKEQKRYELEREAAQQELCVRRWSAALQVELAQETHPSADLVEVLDLRDHDARACTLHGEGDEIRRNEYGSDFPGPDSEMLWGLKMAR